MVRVQPIELAKRRRLLTRARATRPVPPLAVALPPQLLQVPPQPPALMPLLPPMQAKAILEALLQPTLI